MADEQSEKAGRYWKIGGLGLIILLLVGASFGLYGLLRSEAEPAPEGQEAVAQGQEATKSASITSVEATQPAPPAVPEGVSVPEGMAYVPGGTVTIGNHEASQSKRHDSDARPLFTTQVAPFLMDVHPVTVGQFRRFVEDTGYETQAEEFGNAGVLDDRRKQWRLVDGATWEQPFGPMGPAAPSDHPVTQVSWNDAVAYCKWDGKRLPTEVEWEHAARGAQNKRQRYAWGDTLVVNGQYQANTWQGRFPHYNEVADGYEFTAPVGQFAKTELGLTDMGGNVWEWTSSWYRPYEERGEPFEPTRQSEKAQRGGSFQCNQCFGYRVYTRSHSTPETSLFHVGFRCAQDVSSSGG